jgi:nucleoside triphosphate pyrophosphatase
LPFSLFILKSPIAVDDAKCNGESAAATSKLTKRVMTDATLTEKLVLASTSPRRAEILRAVGWPFETLAPDVDETRARDEDAVAYVSRLAQAKAKAAASRLEAGLVLGADTVVVIDGEILGQPRDAEDARRMLRLLSGKWHEVLTGVALVRVGKEAQGVVDHELTRVRFSRMSDAEIDWYIATGEAMGKAGAYAVQGRAALFIEEIQGEYFNVVGLPVRLLYQLAREL